MLQSLRDRLRGGPPGAVPDTRRRLADSVITGRDGMLFHHDGHAVAQITGNRPLAPEVLNLWVSSVETRAAWCRARGIAHRFLIVPEKHVVYSDHLPDGLRPSDKRPAVQIAFGVDAEGLSRIIYPVDALLAGRATRPTYLTTDTHWTHYGALLACRALLASLAAERPVRILGDDEVGWRSHPSTGDLGVRLDPEPSETAESIEFLAPGEVRPVFQNRMFARGALLVLEQDRPDLPRGILFRDSFGVALVPPLARSFSRLVVVGSQSMHYDLLRAERPDVVIVETCERFLGMPDPGQAIELPRDLDGPDFATFSGVALADFVRAPAV